MTIAVIGLWHLGMVTAACLAAEGHDVAAIDEPSIVASIDAGRLPVNEPGLAELIDENRRAGRLRFLSGPSAANGAELLWFCYDTPVDDHGRPDVEWVTDRISAFLANFPGPATVAISSQLPAGSIAALRSAVPGDRFRFACVPENLRLGSAIEYFRTPDRFVIGTDEPTARAVLERALAFAPSLVWMSVQSAEMVKHAINAFLATSVVFANEIAALCERIGADAREVESGLKSDLRIGRKAYVRAGEAFAGGTLARDLAFLAELGERATVVLPQLRATAASNEDHRHWVYERIVEGLGALAGRRIALLGLVYKPGTDTLRASSAVALARKLRSAGALVRAFDPAIPTTDTRLLGVVELAPSAEAALAEADLAVVATSWPQFREIAPAAYERLRERIVIDESRFLEAEVCALDDIRYVAFGRSAVTRVTAR